MAGRGGGTETDTRVGVTGQSSQPDGSPAVGARVTLRTSDYLADPISPTDDGNSGRESFTDAKGRFQFKDLAAGAYRIEVAGSESGGLIQDFSLKALGQRLDLPLDTLLTRGGISGAFAPDSDVQLARFIQVYGMERLVKAGPSGTFLIGNLPAGSYDLRCSSLQPFRRDAVLKGIVVKSGEITKIPEVTLAKEAKLAFRIDSTGLKIEDMEPGNPVILDNERWDNGMENEYIWLKASAGLLNLRGNIVTQDVGGAQKTTIAIQMKKCREDIRVARLAGLKNLKEPVAGAELRIVLPPASRLEDLVAIRSDGSDLIVAEALKATPEKPLIVVAGGPLTTVAQAYLTDPAIASRMIVVGIFSFSINSADTIANFIVSKKCRYLQWGRNYSWGGTLDVARLNKIPKSIMGDQVYRKLAGSPNQLSFGDLAPIAYLFNKGVWKTVDMVKVSSNLVVQPASDITFDFLDIPANANDYSLFQDEVFSTFSDTSAYEPKTVPGVFAAEAYLGNFGISSFSLDSVTGTTGVTYVKDAWTDYHISVATVGKYSITFRYRSDLGGIMSIIQLGSGASGEVSFPASKDWSTNSLDSVSLNAGTSVLRIRSLSGKVDLESLDIHLP
jgi:hypothetical protein